MDKHGRLIDADALIADCQLAQKQADRNGREFANAFYSGGGDISTEWWCVEDMIENAPTIESERRVEELLPNGTLHLFTDTDLSKVKRVWVSQNGTHYGDLYYADGEPNYGADMRGKTDEKT